MGLGLVPLEEEKRICKKLIRYYENLYPGIEFSLSEEELSYKQIGEIRYTYAGEQTEALASEKMKRISTAIGQGYSTPIVILKKRNMNILLDGHRRVRVAYAQGLQWKAMMIIPGKDIKFGIEEMIMGKVKDLYGK